MIKTYLFVKRQRIQKKHKLYEQLIAISFDRTTTFYSLLFIGYFVVALYVTGEVPEFITQILTPITYIATDYAWTIVTIFPLTLAMRANNQPGVTFSSAEYMLTILPNDRRKIWLFVALEKWLKSLLIYTVIGIVFYGITSLSLSQIIIYIVMFTVISIIMTPVQWKLFQQSLKGKLIFISLLMFINFASFLLSEKFVALFMLFVITSFSIQAVRKLFHHVDWTRVTAAGDFAVWNMPLVSRATKIKYKKDKQAGLWSRFKWWQERFPYEKENVYQRLWYLYIEKQFALIAQMTGILFLLVAVVSSFREVYFLIALAIAIHIFTTFLASIFLDRLQSEVVRVLPWDLALFKSTFNAWASLLAISLFIPASFHTFRYFPTISALVYLLLFGIVFFHMLYVKIDKIIERWNEKGLMKSYDEYIGYLLLITICFSGIFPILMFVSLISYVLYFYFNKVRMTA